MSSEATGFRTKDYEVRRWPEQRAYYVVNREFEHTVGNTFRTSYQAEVWALRVQADFDAGRPPGTREPRVTAPADLNGEELRMRREALMFSQARLAAELGVSENTIARWERNTLTMANPRMVNLALDALEHRHGIERS
jgi:DNA-binding transcriptional regulator YiaG